MLMLMTWLEFNEQFYFLKQRNYIEKMGLLQKADDVNDVIEVFMARKANKVQYMVSISNATDQ